MTHTRTAATAEPPETWTSVISPNGRWLDLRLAELWRSRDLIALFVWRDFVAVYKQTVLGPLWYLIQPVLTTLMFTVVFGRIANLSSDGVPHFVFYMAGTVVWTYFATCVTKNANTFVQNAGLFGKVYFPRLAVPMSVLISNMVTFGIQLLLLITVIVWTRLHGGAVYPNKLVLLTPLLLMLLAALGTGVGLVVSAATIKYRDLQQLVAFGVQLLMYATPVIYPASAIGPRYRWLIQANPLTPVVEGFRFAFLGVGTVSIQSLIYSGACAAAILFCGILLFSRVERTFVDSV